MDMNTIPTRLSRGTGVLDDLKLLTDSLPAPLRSTVMSDIKLVFAELSCENGDELASGASV